MRPGTKFLPIMLLLCIMILLVSVCSASSSPMATERDSKEIVTKAFQKFDKVKNYHMSMDIAASLALEGKNMNFVMKGESDVQVKPMIFKNAMTMTMDMPMRRIEQKMEQYAEEVGDHFVVYTQVNNEWVQQFMPNYNQLYKYDNYFKALTKVTPLEETADSMVFEVTVDGKYLKENMEHVMATAGMQEIKLTDDLLKDVGDVTYTLTIDKKRSTISKMDMDLSGLMASIGSNLVSSSKIPDEQKRIFREMLCNMKLNTTIAFSQFNNVEKVIIPKEAKQGTVQIN